MHIKAYVLLLFVAVDFSSVVAYPAGPPASQPGVCDNLQPAHGATAQTRPVPYEIKPNQDCYYLGRELEVTISAKNGETFKGFLLQGRGTASSSVVLKGTFVGPFEPETKAIRCFSTPSNAASHSNPLRKTFTTKTLRWKAPAQDSGEITFTAVIVKSTKVYWQNIQSQTIKKCTGTPPPTPAPPATTAVVWGPVVTAQIPTRKRTDKATLAVRVETTHPRAATTAAESSTARHPHFTTETAILTASDSSSSSSSSSSTPKAKAPLSCGEDSTCSDGTPTWVWIVVGVCAALIIAIAVALVFTWRRKRLTGRAFGYGDERRPSQRQLVATFGATEPNSLEVRFSNGSSVAKMKQAFEKNSA